MSGSQTQQSLSEGIQNAANAQAANPAQAAATQQQILGNQPSTLTQGGTQPPGQNTLQQTTTSQGTPAQNIASLGLSQGSCMLGGIVLDGLQSPDKLPTGGAHRAEVHRLPGGARVIDLMGQDDANIDLSFMLWGPFANNTALQIDAFRQTGQVVQLVWQAGIRTVIVEKFTWDYQQKGHILPCKASLLVVPTAISSSQFLSTAQALIQDLNAAKNVIATDPQTNTNTTPLNNAIQQLPASGQPTPNQAGNAATAAQPAVQGTNSNATGAGTVIQNTTPTAGPDGTSQYMSTISDNAGTMASNYSANSYATRAYNTSLSLA